jgi:hypothetical protein
MGVRPSYKTVIQSNKEKSHVVDYRCDSNHPLAARLFRSEHQLKLPAHGQLDPHFDRHRPDPHRFEAVGDYIVLTQLGTT